MAKCPKCGLDFKNNYRKCPNCRTIISPSRKEKNKDKEIELPKLKSEMKKVVDESNLVSVKKEVKIKPIPVKFKKVTAHKGKEDKSSKIENVRKVKKIVKDKNLAKVKEVNKKKEVKKISKIKEDNEAKIKIISSFKIAVVVVLLFINIGLIVDIVIKVDTNKPSTIVDVDATAIKPIIENVSILGDWKTQNGGLFSFLNNQKFYWYDNYLELEDNFYVGTYNYKQGLEALEDMGYTEEDFYKEFQQDGKIDLMNVYSIEMRPTLSYRNKVDLTEHDLNKDVVWWYLLIINNDNTAYGYNKTLDLRYSLTKNE